MTPGRAGPDPGRVEIRRRWDAGALAASTPPPRVGWSAALIWEEPSNVEGGPSPGLALLLASVLASFGEVAFRSATPVPDALRPLPGPAAPRWRRHRWRAVAASEPAEAALLFEDGWADGDQAAVVGADDARSRDILFAADPATLDLRGDEVLLAALVDGAGALVAAGSEARLAAVLAALEAALAAGGYAVDAPR